MADDSVFLAERVLPLITAAIAYLDSDAAFGPEHERSVRAKEALRGAVDSLIALDRAANQPRLRVIRGGDRRSY